MALSPNHCDSGNISTFAEGIFSLALTTCRSAYLRGKGFH